VRRKVLFLMGFSAVLGLLWPVASFAEGKVGYINLQRLVSESKMGQKAKSDIQKLRSEREAFISNKLEQINNLRKLLNESGDKMPAREKRDRIFELQTAQKEYQRLVSDAKEEILREDRELVATILSQADDVLKTVAKKRKYTIIIKDPNAIGYLDPSVDITDEVIEELNKK
jgi:outer membrane protein